MQYLSEKWFEAANLAVGKITPLEENFSMMMTVTDSPNGMLQYKVVMGPDSVEFVPKASSSKPADVSITARWQTATAIAQGELSAQAAFLKNELTLGGNTTELIKHSKYLAELDDALTELRSHTEF